MTDLSQVLLRVAHDGSVIAQLEECLATQKEFVGQLLRCLAENSSNPEISRACLVLISRWFSLHSEERDLMQEIRPAILETLPFAQRPDLVEQVVQIFSRYISTMTDVEVAQLVGKFKEDDGYILFSLQFSLSLHRGNRKVPFEIDRELIWRAIKASDDNVICIGLDLLSYVGYEIEKAGSAVGAAILEMECFLFTSPEFRPNLINAKVWQRLASVVSVDIPNNVHIDTVMELIKRNPSAELLGGLIMFLIENICDVPEDYLKDICSVIVRYELQAIHEGNSEPWVFAIVRNVYQYFDRTKAFGLFVSLIKELMEQSNPEMFWIAGMVMEELFEADPYQSATYFRETFQGIINGFLQSRNMELVFVALDLMRAAVKYGEQVIHGWQLLVEQTCACLRQGDPIVAGRVYCFLDMYMGVTPNVLPIFKMLCSCIPSSEDLIVLHLAMLVKALDNCIYCPTDVELSHLLTVAQCLQNSRNSSSYRVMGSVLKVRLWCYFGAAEVPEEVGLLFNTLTQGDEIGRTESVCASVCLSVLLAQSKACVNGSVVIQDLMWSFLESLLQHTERCNSIEYMLLAHECVLGLFPNCYRDDEKRKRIFGIFRHFVWPQDGIIQQVDNPEVLQILFMLTRKFARFWTGKNAYALWVEIGKRLVIDNMDFKTYLDYVKILSAILARPDVEEGPKQKAVEIVRWVLSGSEFGQWDVGEQSCIAMYLGGKLCLADESITKNILQVSLDSMRQIPETVASYACPFLAKFMISSPFRTEADIQNIFACLLGILQSQSPNTYWWDIIATFVRCAQADKGLWRPILASHTEFFMNLYRALMQDQSLKTVVAPILATLLLQISLNAPDQFPEEDIVAFLTTRYESTITFPKAHMSVLLELAQRDCSNSLRDVLCREVYWLIDNPNLRGLVPPMSKSPSTREYAQARRDLMVRVIQLDPERQILAQATEGQTQRRQHIASMCDRVAGLTSQQ